MNKHLVFASLNNLGLQPLTDCVAHINPHADLELSLLYVKLFDIPVVFWILPELVDLPIIVSSVAERRITCEMLDPLSDIISVLGVEQLPDVFHGSGEHIEGLCLVESDLLEIVPCILLENQPAIPSQNTGLTESSEDFLNQVQVSSRISCL